MNSGNWEKPGDTSPFELQREGRRLTPGLGAAFLRNWKTFVSLEDMNLVVFAAAGGNSPGVRAELCHSTRRWQCLQTVLERDPTPQG